MHSGLTMKSSRCKQLLQDTLEPLNHGELLRRQLSRCPEEREVAVQLRLQRRQAVGHSRDPGEAGGLPAACPEVELLAGTWTTGRGDHAEDLLPSHETLCLDSS